MGKKKSSGKSKSKKTSTDTSPPDESTPDSSSNAVSKSSSSGDAKTSDLKSFFTKMPPNQLDSLTKIKLSAITELLITLTPHYSTLYKKSLGQFSTFSSTHSIDEVPCCVELSSKKKNSDTSNEVVKWLGPLTQKECKEKGATTIYTFNVRTEIFSAVSSTHYLPALVSHSLTSPFPLYQDSWLALKFTNLLTHPHPTSNFELVLSGEMRLKGLRDLMKEEFQIKNVDEVRFKFKKRKTIVDPNSEQKLKEIEGIEKGIIVVKDMGKEHKGGWFLDESFSEKDKKELLPSLLFSGYSNSKSTKSPLLTNNASTHGFNILSLAYSHLVCRTIMKQFMAESEARKNENDLIAMMMDEEKPDEGKKEGKSKSQKKKEKEKQKKAEAEKKKKEEEEEKERQYKEMLEKQKSKAQDAKKIKEEEEERVRLEAEERWNKREEEERMLEEERMNEMLNISDKASRNAEKERQAQLAKEEELRQMEEQARLLEEQMNMKLAVDSDSDEEDDLLAMLKAEEEQGAGSSFLDPASLGGLVGGDLPEPPKMMPLPLKPGELLESEVMNSGVMGLLDDDDE